MKKDTRIVHGGSHPDRFHGAVNPPVYRASTILSPDLATQRERYKNRFDEVFYGRYGTPTTMALEEAVAEVEGGTRCIAVGSGLQAVTATLTALVESGDHVLVTDSAYGPTRNFCDQVLARMGVETTYYDPAIGADIAGLIRDTTKAVFTESPGSLTFEMQDIPAIAKAAHARGVLVVMDNTWGLLSFQPFEKGVDISIQAATKYVVGHSDAMLGTITVNDAGLYTRLKTNAGLYGFAAGSEEAWLGLRGLRTLSVRLERQFKNGLKVARWLQERPEVKRVMHPALPEDPGHAIWSRDFTGGCGLFAIELQAFPAAAVEAMVNGYAHFGLGFSWGGYESLVVLASHLPRTATPAPDNDVLRFHIGLEDVDDLIADLERGFDRLNANS